MWPAAVGTTSDWAGQSFLNAQFQLVAARVNTEVAREMGQSQQERPNMDDAGLKKLEKNKTTKDSLEIDSLLFIFRVPKSD